MHDTNAPTLPIEFARDIFTAMAGTNVADFDDADFAALPAQGQVSASFVISHGPNDIKQAVDTAWPYHAGTRNIDALVVVRGNGMNMDHFKTIQHELRSKLHDTSTLLISVSKSNTLPPGTVSIILLAIAHNKAKSTPSHPYLKLVVQDEAHGQPE